MACASALTPTSGLPPHLLDSLKLRDCLAISSVAKLVLDGREAADRRVQAHGVVTVDPGSDGTPCLAEPEWRPTKWCNFRAARTPAGRATGRSLACQANKEPEEVPSGPDPFRLYPLARGHPGRRRHRRDPGGGGVRAPGPHRSRSSSSDWCWPLRTRRGAPDKAQRLPGPSASHQGWRR